MSQADTFIPEGAASQAGQPDLLGAVNDFILAFCLPALPQERLLRAHQNRVSLPPPGPNSEDYAVFQQITSERRGTNVSNFVPGADEFPDVTLVRKLSIEEVQVDFYGPHAPARAQALAVLAWSQEGVAFFNRYGLSSCHASEPVNNTGLSGPGRGGAGQYVPRWTVRLFISQVTAVSVRQPGFDTATLERLENVDVGHPQW